MAGTPQTSLPPPGRTARVCGRWLPSPDTCTCSEVVAGKGVSRGGWGPERPHASAGRRAQVVCDCRWAWQLPAGARARPAGVAGPAVWWPGLGSATRVPRQACPQHQEAGEQGGSHQAEGAAGDAGWLAGCVHGTGWPCCGFRPGCCLKGGRPPLVLTGPERAHLVLGASRLGSPGAPGSPSMARARPRASATEHGGVGPSCAGPLGTGVPWPLPPAPPGPAQAVCAPGRPGPGLQRRRPLLRERGQGFRNRRGVARPRSGPTVLPAVLRLVCMLPALLVRAGVRARVRAQRGATSLARRG